MEAELKIYKLETFMKINNLTNKIHKNLDKNAKFEIEAQIAVLETIYDSLIKGKAAESLMYSLITYCAVLNTIADRSNENIKTEMQQTTIKFYNSEIEKLKKII